MATVSSTTLINQPVEKVFEYVVNVANHKSWQAGILEATVTPPGPVNLGSMYNYTSEVMGRRIQSQMKVTGYVPNQTWAVTTVPTPVETTYTFEPAGSGTKLTIIMQLSGGYPAAAEAMVKQQMQKSLDEQGNRIKQMVGG
jgi:uncharacterized protein YndB with AHSA1/START domain